MQIDSGGLSGTCFFDPKLDFAFGVTLNQGFKALVQGHSKSFETKKSQFGQKNMLLRDPMNRFVSP